MHVYHELDLRQNPIFRDIFSNSLFTINAKTNPDHTTSSGPFYIVKTTSNGVSTGIAYSLDGTTKKDLATGNVYTANTTVTLKEIADYRFTLTEG